MTPRGERGHDDLAARILSPRPFPHELVALGFVAAGIAVLELLPVTYPRAALVRVWSAPIAVVLAIAVAIAGSASILRRRRGLPGPGLAAQIALLARAALVLVPTLSVHFLLKGSIHLVNPRVWDRQLDRLDTALHLGVSPSAFLPVLLHNPALLHVVDLVYSVLYFLVLVTYTAVLLGLLPTRRKLAFIAAFLLVWILGMALYLALPSWGPAFVFPERFADVLPFMPNTATVQGALFEEIRSLVSNPTGFRVLRFGCVAAFPSLHVAVVALLALASRAVSRRWFRVNVALVLVMVIGSVITGYHYLVDSYAGVLLAGASWWAGRAIYDRPERQEPEIDTVAPAV